jgi:NAD dependent epimerase/dehydratase family enzyme
MLTPFRLGLGGPVGSGRQFWPWIAIGDVCGVVEHVLHNDAINGPVNVVSSEEVRSLEFARTLGRVLSRPAVMPMPAFAARIAMGEMADSLLLASQRVRPRILEESGYEFTRPTLDQAIRAALD